MNTFLVASLLLAPALTPAPLSPPAQLLADACIAEGESRTECICYAGFIEKNSSERELKALATLIEPKNRESLEQAFSSLMQTGLTPAEIFDIGMRVEELSDDATKVCKGK